MKISVRIIVKDIRTIDRDKTGQPLRSPFQVMTAFDRDAAGELQLNFPKADCPFTVTQEVKLDADVKGRARGYNVVYDVIGLAAAQ